MCGKLTRMMCCRSISHAYTQCVACCEKDDVGTSLHSAAVCSTKEAELELDMQQVQRPRQCHNSIHYSVDCLSLSEVLSPRPGRESVVMLSCCYTVSAARCSEDADM